MSNFTGVTFAQQKVTPSDDAIVRRAMLADGVLSGCELSYSGSTLTMAAGHLMVCGRQIRHPASQNWAVVDATSGYARLLLTIDLTLTATKDAFEQVVDSIEYATSADGFPELEQTDINVAGTRYQIEVCVVSLGTGGISGIVSKLEKCEAGGTGGLNFKLVGGLTQPADPADNLIWVNTAEDITGYALTPEQPDTPEEGTVWIKTGLAGAASLNILKKNQILLYLNTCCQYLQGAWVRKEASIWQDDEWKQFATLALYLFEEGSGEQVTFTSLTEVQVTNDHVRFYSSGGNAYLAPADLTENKTLYAEVICTGRGSDSYYESWGGSLVVKNETQYGGGAANTANRPDISTARAHFEINADRHEVTLDVSALTGSYYVGIAGSFEGYLYNLWLE